MSEAFEPSARILIVEDEADQRELVARILEGRGCTVRQSGSAEEAAELLEGEDFDLVLSDWKLPGEHGIWLLGMVRERRPDTAFVLATAYGSISHAVEAVRQGAVDRYLRLLRAGGSDYPMHLLARAGVDLSKPDTVRAVVSHLDGLVSRLEGELDL